MLASKIKKILLIFIILITLISVTIFVTKDKSKTTNITFTLTDMKEEDIKYSLINLIFICSGVMVVFIVKI